MLDGKKVVDSLTEATAVHEAQGRTLPYTILSCSRIEVLFVDPESRVVQAVRVFSQNEARQFADKIRKAADEL